MRSSLSSSEPGGPGIVLKTGREGPVRRRHHPWVYSQAVERVEEAGADAGAAADAAGGLLPVRSADGSVIGWGQYSPGSLIAVRMVTFSAERPSDDWVEQRIGAAWDLRTRARVGQRLVPHRERGGRFSARAGHRPLCRHRRRLSAHAGHGGAPRQDCGLPLRPAAGAPGFRPAGRALCPRRETVRGFRVRCGARATGRPSSREGNVRLKVDFARGQKTGFYLDQRANRTLIAQSCAGKDRSQPVLVHGRGRPQGGGGRAP